MKVRMTESYTNRGEVLKERCHMYQQRQPEPEMELNRQPESRKVPVVYYLCRNQQIEHPHFIEVSLVSPDGLYLRDVIEKLDALRGRGMASMYSWSCKRSYRNAFVWNDLCEDDLIFPAHGNEYVLKGSELIEENNSGRFSSTRNNKSQNLKQLPEPHSSITEEDDCPSSTTTNNTETKTSHDNDRCHIPTKYKIYNTHDLTNASTQTNQHLNIKKIQETCTTSFSTNIQRDPSTSSSSSRSSASKTATLESLMKADINKPNTNTKLSASDMLLQWITCGSVSQDHEFGRDSCYGSRSLDSRFSSRLMSENKEFIGRRFEDKQYFSGSLVEMKLLEREGVGCLKRSSSDNVNRINKCDSTLTPTKCIPRSIRASLNKHPRSASMRFSERPDSCIFSPCRSNDGSKSSSAKKQSKKMESFVDNMENVVKIEERLSSGARVIIHLEANDCPALTR